MWAFSWVLIPIAGILAGAWSEWLKFKEKQSKLGASAETLEASFETLSKKLDEQNQELVRRIQNLEAIVTSADWDQLTATEKMPSSSLPGSNEMLELPSMEAEIEDEAARIAKRLRS